MIVPKFCHTASRYDSQHFNCYPAHQVELQREELDRLREERDLLQDGAAGITKDDVLEQTRTERDEAKQQYVTKVQKTVQTTV